MSAWLLILLAVIHAAASVDFLLQGKYGPSVVMLGGMIVQLGLLLTARS